MYSIFQDQNARKCQKERTSKSELSIFAVHFK